EDETGPMQEQKIDVEGHEKTLTLFYDSVEEFDAKVLAVKGKWLILDSTAFYPEGGGQIFDIGEINGQKVSRVQKEKGVILHEIERPEDFKPGQIVHGKVDGARRKQISRHHTAIHLINACAREILGPHIWQGGSYKDENKAQIDLTHYKKITDDELDKIEKLANDYVLANLPIKTQVLPRMEAEAKYGFRLYQGGAVPGKELRVVSIGDIDHEACGGTHNYNKSTSELGYIKIVKREGVQDGLERIIIKCGPAAVDYVQKRERLLKEAASALAVPENNLKDTILRFFSEWKERGKEIERLQAILSEQISQQEIVKAKKEGRSIIELIGVSYSQKLSEEICSRISKEGYCAVVQNSEGFIVAMAPLGSGQSALELIKKRGGKGGGSEQFARGKVAK
ncbi:MAG: alanine--tRNA ligase-related protein, partial [Candidatus Anstonellaceae archaeon]